MVRVYLLMYFNFKTKINIKISHDINNSHESTGFIPTNSTTDRKYILLQSEQQ